MYADRPIIGIAGGIGSGKSTVADLLGEFGALVIHSDELVGQAYKDVQILEVLREWWGKAAVDSSGQVDRLFVAQKIFSDPTQKKRLEALIHPWVAARRQHLMAQRTDVWAYVWDTPLLFESGLNQQCDCVIFVEVPLEVRLARVASSRGWSERELLRREKLQMSLDKKRQMSDYIVCNTGTLAFIKEQIAELHSRINNRWSRRL